MEVSRVRMFAGPNGSGKSELISRLQDSDLPLGPVINADELLNQIKNSGFIDFKEYSLSEVNREKWDLAIKDKTELSSRVKKAGGIPKIQIKENLLICDAGELNAYAAALIADFIRYMMVEQKRSFTFETVMSHPGKIDFLKFAQNKGYKTYLYFIATDDPSININRVKNRVQKGGHNVSEDKILKVDIIGVLICYTKRYKQQTEHIFSIVQGEGVLYFLKRRMMAEDISR